MNSFAVIFQKNIQENNLLDEKALRSSLDERAAGSFDKFCKDQFSCYLTSSTNDSIFVSSDERFIVLADMRIDNMKELNDKIPDSKDFSKAELVLELYKKYHEKCFSIIEGPFSIVIIDVTKKKIISARDLFGQRPLHFYEDQKKIIICSEPSSIFSQKVEKILNIQTILNFLLLDYKKTGDTFFNNIYKINGGKYFLFNGESSYVQRYIEFPKRETKKEKSEVYIKRFKRLLEEVITDQLKNTKEIISSTLSGGLDSSAISLILDKNKKDKIIRSYSVHFSDLNPEEKKIADEKYFVDKVLKKSSLRHSYINVKLDESSPIKYAEKYNNKHFPYSMVNGYIHKNIYDRCHLDNSSEIFDGLFGDEIISHGTFRLQELLKKGRIVSFFFELYFLKKNKQIGSIKHQIKINIILPFKNLLKNLFRKDIALSYEDLSSLISDDYINQISQYKRNVNRVFTSEYDEQIRFFNSGQVEHALEQLDFFLSRKDLNCFYPFLDKRIAFNCIKIPTSMKLKKGITRYYYREALKDILPREIYKRLSKGNLSAYSKKNIKKNYRQIILELKKSRSNIYKLIDFDELERRMDLGFKDSSYLLFHNCHSLDIWLNNNNLSI